MRPPEALAMNRDCGARAAGLTHYARLRDMASYVALTMVLLVGAVSSSASEVRTESGHGRFIGAMPTTYPDWFKESFLEFRDDIEEAAAAGKRVAVLFHQDGCPYCNALVERNLSQRDIESLLKDKFEVIAVNMWGDRDVVSVSGEAFSEKAFAAAMQVQFTPTILFFNERAELALRLDGYLPPTAFKRALEYVAGKHESRISYRDYVAREAGASTPGPVTTRSPFTDTTRREAAKPTVVLFEQSDCPNCATLHQRVFSLPETSQLLSGFNRVRVDMWSNKPVVTPAGEQMSARRFADALGISYAPSLVVFDAKGQEVIRTSAYFKRFHTQGVLQYVASGAYLEEPSFQRYLNARAETLRAQGQDVNIWD